MNFKTFKNKYGIIRFLKGKNDYYYNAEDVAKILGYYEENTNLIIILIKYINIKNIKTIKIKKVGEFLFIDSYSFEILMNKSTTEKGHKFREWYLDEFIKTLENPIKNNYTLKTKKS